jgi:hypothetical protein
LADSDDHNNKMTNSTESNSTDGFIERDADKAKSSSSSGSTYIYKIHRQSTAGNKSSSEEGTAPTIGVSDTIASQSPFDKVIKDDDNNGEE